MPSVMDRGLRFFRAFRLDKLDCFRANERTRTADLISLRVISHPLQGVVPRRLLPLSPASGTAIASTPDAASSLRGSSGKAGCASRSAPPEEIRERTD